MLSPKLAATSVLIWVMALTGNVIWAIDSFKLKNWPWVGLGIFFCTLNILLIWSRVTGFELLTVVQPIFDTLGITLP